MKIKGFLTLARASVSSRKFNAGLFCLFITLASACIFISIAVALPLAVNIETKINNHIQNRELNVDFLKGAPSESTEAYIEQIRSVKHVVSVYRKTNTLFVYDGSQMIKEGCVCDFVHNGYELELKDGRLFEETETKVALAPDKIHYFDEEMGAFTDVFGKDLLGKTMHFTSDAVNFDAKIVGVYNTADEIFSNTPFLLPQNDLIKYYTEMEAFYDKDREEPVDTMLHYIIETDSHFNTKRVMSDVSKIYPLNQTMSIYGDSETYNLTVIISLSMLILFIAVTAAGVYMFLQNGVKSRTSEIALYRSIGYKSNHLFLLLFLEYFILGVVSIALGTVLALIINTVVVDPMMLSLTGNTIIETKAVLKWYEVILMLLFFTELLRTMSKRTVKKTENTDLTILMKA